MFTELKQWRIQDFPEVGAPTPKVGIILHILCAKLHKNERIWTPGVRPRRPPPWIPQCEKFLVTFFFSNFKFT